MSTLAKNTLYLTVASVAQKAIAFVYFTLVANQIGKESQGDYFLALSVTTILSVVSDWGLSSVLIREVAKKPEDAVRTLRTTLGLKIPLIVIAMAGSIGLSVALGYEASVIRLVTLATLILAADAISLTFFGALRGLQNLRYESLGIFIGQTLTATFGLIALRVQPSLSILILALLLGSAWNAVFSATRVVKHLGLKAIVPSFESSRAKQMLRWSLSFALASLFVKVYSYIDTILLKAFIGSAAVGAYSIAYKITYAFQFLPMAFVGGLYPAMSARFAKGDTKGLRQVFDDAMWYMAILAMPITLGIALMSDQIITRFYPQYTDAIVPLSILVFALLFLFLDFPVGSLLNAAHKQHIKAAVMGVTMLISATLNAILIPRLNIPGASVSAVISFAFLLIAGFWFVPRIIPYSFVDLIKRIAPMVASGLLMALMVIAVKPILPFYLTIIIAALTYGVALFLTGGVGIGHLKNFRRILGREVPEPAEVEPPTL